MAAMTLPHCANELNQYDATDDDPQDSPSPTETFDYDLDGNLIEDGDYTHEWDAENRLVGVEPVFPDSADDKKVTFTYDYLGRRVEKAVYAWDEQAEEWETTPTLHRKFVWYNWLMLLELDGDNEIVRKYTWGLDLAGQNGAISDIQSAGGIGGLLAMYDPNDPNDPNDTYGNCVCFYDANGNVGQLVDRENDGTLVAKYEYDPYGNNLLDPTDPQESGQYAADNPIRFSTKYFDDETGLSASGYRYSGARLGRWLSRDALNERGGRNLYLWLRNDPVNTLDPLGLCPYKVGPAPPPLPEHDVGSGKWGVLSPTRRDYGTWMRWRRIAKIADALGYDNAARHMLHYLGNTGSTLTVDFCAMLKEDAKAQDKLYEELNSAMTFAERYSRASRKKGFIISGTRWCKGTTEPETDWWWAVGNYDAWGKGVVRHSRHSCRYSMTFTLYLRDRYNWDAGKVAKVAGEVVLDEELGRLHKVGLAQEFNMEGSCTVRVRWCYGGRLYRSGPYPRRSATIDWGLDLGPGDRKRR
jgi:RHS repeat-associated protein